MSTKQDIPTAGVLAGPETAAEHVRNAMQMIDGGITQLGHGFVLCHHDVQAIRARLARALAALEGTGAR